MRPRMKTGWKNVAVWALTVCLTVTSFLPFATKVEAAGTKFASITEIDFYDKANGNLWWTEVFFIKDSSFPADRLAYGNLTAEQKSNAFMNAHEVVYCMEGDNANPSGQTPDTSGDFASAKLTTAQKNALINVLKNGYPANKEYWSSKGVSSYLKQAAATQLALWVVGSSLKVSGNDGWDLANYRSDDAALWKMTQELVACGKNTSKTFVDTSIVIGDASVTESGDNYVYSWTVTAKNCNWNTKLTLSEIPNGASIRVYGQPVTFKDNVYTTSLNNRTYPVTMTVPKEGNEGKAIELIVNAHKPNTSPTSINFFATSKTASDGRKYQNMLGSITTTMPGAETKRTLTTPVSVKYRFIKRDAAGNALSGCAFEIRDSQGNVVDSWITDDTGIHESVDVLTAGETYVLKETACPPEYTLAEDQTFTATRKTTFIEVVTVNQQKFGSIHIKKVDPTEGGIAGVELSLYVDHPTDGEAFSWNGMTWYLVEAKTTGSDGTVSFENLECSTARYLLAETRTADGKVLLKEPVELGSLPKTEAGKSPVYVLEYEIENGSNFDLPMTGAMDAATFTYVGGAGMALLMTIVLFRKKGERNNE